MLVSPAGYMLPETLVHHSDEGGMGFTVLVRGLDWPCNRAALKVPSRRWGSFASIL